MQGRKPNGTTHKAKKHQNTTAYKILYNPHLIGLKDNSDTSRLCEHCFPVVKWKLTFGKYKPRTNAGLCNKCGLKKVFKAYRHVCDSCADEHKVCTKCGDPTKAGYHSESKIIKNDYQQSLEDNLGKAEMAKLKERSRRKLKRLQEDKLVGFKDGKFVYKAGEKNGLEISCIYYRKRFVDEEGKLGDGEEDGDEDGSGDDEDDDEDDDDY